MGIKDIKKILTTKREGNMPAPTKTFTPTVYVDAAYIILRYSKTFIQSKTLSNKSGVRTLCIQNCINLIMKMVNLGTKQVWVFDNPTEPCPMKENELKMRRLATKKVTIKGKEMKNARQLLMESKETGENKELIEELTKQIDKNDSNMNAIFDFRKNVKFLVLMLRSFGIPYVFAPAKVDGEKYASYLTKGDPHAYVLTTDTDVLLFGASNFMSPIRKKSGKYEFRNLSTALKDTNLTDISDLIKLGLVLGCDYCPKTYRVGPKTALKKLPNIVLSDEQKKAIKVYTDFSLCEKQGKELITRPISTETAIKVLKSLDFGEKFLNRVSETFGELEKTQNLTETNDERQ